MSKMKICTNPQNEKQKKNNRKASCANARATMSRKEYKEFIEKGRCTMGRGLHSDVFKTEKYDKKNRRRENKKLCREVSYFNLKAV